VRDVSLKAFMSHKTVNIAIPADDAIQNVSLFDFRLDWLVAFHSSRKFVTLCFNFHFN
jgi:hypothetical protein